MVRKSMSEWSFSILERASLPLAVLAPLVEIVATMERSSPTASKSNTPPHRSANRSRENLTPKFSAIQLRLTQSSVFYFYLNARGHKRLHHFGDALRSSFHNFVVSAGGFLVPLPGVLESLDLSGGAGAVLLRKEHVVILIALRRI